MFFCPNCHKEVRYIARAPSMGNAGDPIAVEAIEEYLITESGRRVAGFREHHCPKRESREGIITSEGPKER